MKTKNVLLRITLLVCCIFMTLFLFHFIASVFLSLESNTLDFLHRKTSAAKNQIAESWGFQRKIELDAFTAEQLAEREALRAGLNPALVRAVMHVESGNKQYAESPKGAIGLMQIMPANAKRVGLDHWSKLYDSETNIKAGVQILKEELDRYRGDVIKALVSYNGGPRAVANGYPESVRYAQLVLARMSKDVR